MKIKDGAIYPGEGIGEISLNMTKKELLKIMGSDFKKRKIASGSVIEVENAAFWLDKKNRVDQIGVHGDFKGKFNDIIGIGSTLSDVKKYIGNYVPVDVPYELEDFKGIGFELGDMDEFDDYWDELAAPIERIFVWRCGEEIISDKESFWRNNKDKIKDIAIILGLVLILCFLAVWGRL